MDRISKAQKADVLTQFSEMKKEEGRKEERKRIAEKLANKNYCYLISHENCTDNCVICLEKYLET